MNKPLGRRYNARKTKPGQAIAEAAMRLFLEMASDKVKSSPDRRGALMSRSTPFFNYFPTKEDLFFGSHPGGESACLASIPPS